MTPINKFIRTTMAGGILFMIPLVVTVTVVRKSMEVLERLAAPWEDQLQDEIIWGLNGQNLVGLTILVFLCFLCGLLFRVSAVRSSISKIEDNVLSYIPGYTLLRSLANDALKQNEVNTMMAPILVTDDDGYKPGFLIEQRDEWCTVFIPEAPQANTGELKIIPAGSVTRLSVGTNAMNHMIRNMGRGIGDFVVNKQA